MFFARALHNVSQIIGILIRSVKYVHAFIYLHLLAMTVNIVIIYWVFIFWHPWGKVGKLEHGLQDGYLSLNPQIKGGLFPLRKLWQRKRLIFQNSKILR